jgi:hypothetical protein
MPAGATYMDQYGNTWTAPGGSFDGETISSYFFAGPISSIPPPMQEGWGGFFGRCWAELPGPSLMESA